MYPETRDPYAGPPQPSVRTWSHDTAPAAFTRPPVRVVSAAVLAPPPRPLAPHQVARLPQTPLPQTPLPLPQAPPPPPAPPTPPKVKTAGYTAQLGLVQVIWWQVALAAALASVRQPWPVVAAAVTSAVAVLALTAVRVRGRWLYETVLVRCRFLARGRLHGLPERDPTAARALSLMRLLLPGTTTGTLETAHGTVLTVSHPGGLSALVQPRDARTTSPFPAPAQLLATLSAADGEPHEFAVQTVSHTGSAPGTPPRHWLSIQAVRTVRTPVDEDLALVLRNALRRVRRSCERAGVPTDALPQDAALAAVAALAHVTRGRDELREEWTCWRTGPISQACFTLDGWARLTADDAARLTAFLPTYVPGIAVTLTRRVRSGDVEDDAVLRLAATSEKAVDAASDRLTAFLAASAVRPARLDGRHLHGVAASLPLGGSLS